MHRTKTWKCADDEKWDKDPGMAGKGSNNVRKAKAQRNHGLGHILTTTERYVCPHLQLRTEDS